VSEGDLRDADTRVAEYLRERVNERDGHSSGIVGRQVVALAEKRAV
jgi:hypothetical protein